METSRSVTGKSSPSIQRRPKLSVGRPHTARDSTSNSRSRVRPARFCSARRNREQTRNFVLQSAVLCRRHGAKFQPISPSIARPPELESTFTRLQEINSPALSLKSEQSTAFLSALTNGGSVQAELRRWQIQYENAPEWYRSLTKYVEDSSLLSELFMKECKLRERSLPDEFSTALAFQILFSMANATEIDEGITLVLKRIGRVFLSAVYNLSFPELNELQEVEPQTLAKILLVSFSEKLFFQILRVKGRKIVDPLKSETLSKSELVDMLRSLEESERQFLLREFQVPYSEGLTARGTAAKDILAECATITHVRGVQTSTHLDKSSWEDVLLGLGPDSLMTLLDRCSAVKEHKVLNIFCDVLLSSHQLLPFMIQNRPEVLGRVLEDLHASLSVCMRKQGGTAPKALKKIMNPIKACLRKLFSLLCEQEPSLFENLVRRNKYMLRNVLEKESVGADLLASVAGSSTTIIETVVKAGNGKLGYIFQKNLNLFNSLLVENPTLMLSQTKAHPDCLAHVFQHDVSQIVILCERMPEILSALLSRNPSVMAGVITEHPPVLCEALRFCPDDRLSAQLVLKENQDVFVGRSRLLKACGLLNLQQYRESGCKDAEVQTMPVRNKSSSRGKARSLVEVIGRKKVRSSQGTPFRLQDFYGHLGKIIRLKISADVVDMKAGHEPESLSEVIADYFTDIDRSQSKRFMLNMLATIKKHSDKRLVYWIGVATGCLSSDYFNPCCSDILLMMLSSVVDVLNVEEIFEGDCAKVVIPRQSLLNAVSSVVSVFWSECNTEKLEEILNFVRGLQSVAVKREDLSLGDRPWAHVETLAKERKLTRRDSKKPKLASVKPVKKDLLLQRIIAKTKVIGALKVLGSKRNISPEAVDCVFLTDGLDILLTNWLESEKEKVDSLVELYKEADTNGDGTLDFGEFYDLVTTIDPTCDERTIKRMFKHTGESTDTGEQTISPLEFVEVIRTIT